jgi:hypothetical protein
MVRIPRHQKNRKVMCHSATRLVCRSCTVREAVNGRPAPHALALSAVPLAGLPYLFVQAFLPPPRGFSKTAVAQSRMSDAVSNTDARENRESFVFTALCLVECHRRYAEEGWLGTGLVRTKRSGTQTRTTNGQRNTRKKKKGPKRVSPCQAHKTSKRKGVNGSPEERWTLVASCFKAAVTALWPQQRPTRLSFGIPWPRFSSCPPVCMNR